VQQRVQASSFDAMCRLVETRLGITMLPEGVLAPHAAAGRLAIVGLNEKWALRQMLLVVRDREQLSPIAKTLLDHLSTAGAEPRRSTAR
jgi:DNA-binding transcriptional LysR family regulator